MDWLITIIAGVGLVMALACMLLLLFEIAVRLESRDRNGEGRMRDPEVTGEERNSLTRSRAGGSLFSRSYAVGWRRRTAPRNEDRDAKG